MREPETSPSGCAPTIHTLDEIRRIIACMPPADTKARQQAVLREAQLTKPAGALGRLEELSAWLAAWQGRYPPTLDQAHALVFAGNHGITAHGVSAYPAAVTAEMVDNFRQGGAAINQLCRVFGVELSVVPLSLERPTKDFTQAPAMDEADLAAAFAVGFGAVPLRGDVVCLGEMGIGNTTVAAALAGALFDGDAAEWTGRGTGVDDDTLSRKRQVVQRAIARHRPEAADPLDLLRRLGGRELAAIAGAVVAARIRRIPALLDGYVATAAAAPLAALRPDALDHCHVAHVSAEPGHQRLIERLGCRALLSLDMRLGEASGAVLAVALLRAAVACHTGMRTFGEAGVSGPSDAG